MLLNTQMMTGTCFVKVLTVFDVDKIIVDISVFWW